MGIPLLAAKSYSNFHSISSISSIGRRSGMNYLRTSTTRTQVWMYGNPSPSSQMLTKAVASFVVVLFDNVKSAAKDLFDCSFRSMVCVTVAASLVLVAILYRLVRKLLKIPWISDIESRYILITGCDTGFGNAAAKKLDAMGCNVIAACLTESGETELKKSCSNKLKTVHLDVSKPESVRKAFNAVVGSVLPPGKG